MVTRRSLHSLTGGWRRGNKSAGKDANRKLFLEQLEDRRLLAVGPQIIGIQPNDGDLLLFDEPDQIRSTAPRELLFRFDENQIFDASKLDGIQITRSNLDAVSADEETRVWWWYSPGDGDGVIRTSLFIH